MLFQENLLYLVNSPKHSRKPCLAFGVLCAAKTVAKETKNKVSTININDCLILISIIFTFF